MNLEVYINTTVLMFGGFWGKHEMGTHMWWYRKNKPLTSTHEAQSKRSSALSDVHMTALA
jgi:hypothetical protein